VKLFSSRGKASYSLFFATDLHGSETCFRKFLKAADFYRVDALVLGGDLTGKLMVPIVKQPDGQYRATFLDHAITVSEGSELAELEKNIRFNGQYVYHCDPAGMERMGADATYRDQQFQAAMRADLERWMDEADVALAEGATPCTGIPGNDDEQYVGEVLGKSVRIVNGEQEIAELGPFQVLSCGFSNPTPWNSPRELSEEELAEMIEEAAGRLEAGRPTIFNVHVPPFGSGLDLAPEVTDDLRLRGGATPHMKPVGSTAVADAITRHQPVLSLHGHVHESRGSTKIGEAVALNPGSEYNAGVLRGVIVRMSHDRVLSHQFVAA
jgi:uncharacterized protein